MQKIRRKILISLLGLFVLGSVALPAIAQSTQQKIASDSVIEKIKKRGVIKIGLSVFVPWSMRDKKGDLIGFELDVGRQLAKDMGVDVEFVPTAWDGIIPALLSGKFDVIISGMSITTKRNLTVNFSDPYAYTGMKLLANQKMTKGFSEEDFNNPDVTFAARRGATPVAAIKKNFPKAKLLQFDEDSASTQEVLNGHVHATMISEPVPSREVRTYPDVLYIPFDKTYAAAGSGFAYKKGDPDASNFFNAWIAAKWRDGWLKARNDYWFTTDEWEDQIAK